MADGGVTVEQGLAMMTTGSAYTIRQDDAVGSLTPGRFADLLVLTDDLLTVPSDELPRVEVLMTMIGGVTEFCASGAEALCPSQALPQGPDVSASGSRPGQDPFLAFDGIVTGDSFWSSGAEAQSIGRTFPSPES